MAFSAGAGGADLGSARGEIILDVAAAERSLKQLQGSVGTFASTTESSFQRIATGIGLLAGARKLGGMFTDLVSGAGDFEQAIANINAVADLTSGELEQVRQKALQLGKDSTFSATEAAGAMEELAKGGVSVAEILNGAADGAVALAAAAGTGLPEAAALISTSLNQFQAGGDQATHFADLFAAAANSSQASATEIGQGFAYAGGQAHLLGISAEDLATSLAILSDAGLGERAGTSLNQALSSLAAPTDQATAALNTLGVSAFDAAGNFKPLPALLQDLSTAMHDMSIQQKEALLSDIFGEQGMRAILPLIQAQTDAADEAGKGWEQYEEKVTKAGAAQETAAKRMDTFQGSIEQMRGSIETVSIAIGSHFLPAARKMVDAITEALNVFLILPDQVQAMTGVLIAAAAAVLGIAGAMVLAGPKAAAFADSLKAIRVALLGINPIILAIVGALALFAVAYKTNFGGFADAVDGAVKRVREFGRVFARSFAFSRSLPELGNLGAAFAAVGQAMTEILGINVYKQFRTIGNIADRIGKSLNRMARQFRILGRVIERGGLAAGFDQLFGKVGLNLLAEFGDVIGALPRTVGTALRQITTGIKPVDTALHNLGSAFEQFGRFIENTFAGNFDTALQNLQNIGKRLKAGAIDISGIAVRVVSWAIETAVDLGAAVRSFVTDDLWPRVKSTAAEIADGAVNVISWAVDTATDLGAAVADWVTQTGWPAVKDIATDIADAALSVTSWTVQAASGIWDAVSATALAAWDLVKNVAIDIPDAILSVVHFVVSLGDSVWGAIGGAVLTAWDFVKDTAIQIKDVALSVFNWVTDQIDAGTLVDSVRQFAEDTLATLNVTIDNWTLTVGAPGDDQISVDVSAIWDKIWNDIINPTFTPEQTQAAEDAGSNIGAKAVELLVKGIKLAFGIGGKAGGGGTGEEQLTGKDIVGQFIKGFFEGAFGEALGVGADLSEQARAWARNTLTAIRKAISDIFTGDFLTGPESAIATGHGTPGSGIFDSLRDLFTTNPLEGIKFPDLISPVTKWFAGQIEGLKTGVKDQIPDWLQKLAGGDVLGAVKSLFGSGGGGAATTPLSPQFSAGSEASAIARIQFRRQQLAGNKPEPEAAPVPFLDNVNNRVITLDTTLAQRVPSILAAMRQLASGGGDGAVGGAGSALTDFAKNLPELKLPAPDLSGLTKGLSNAVRETSRAVAEIIDEARGIIGPLSNAGQQAAQSFANGISAGMRIAIGAAATGAQQVVNAARANLSTLGPAGFGVGQSLGFGIANGISSTVGAVINAAVSLVFAAVNAAKFAAQIASPSKLMAKEVGLPLAQGVALGIDTGQGTVKRSIGDLIGAAIPSTSTASMVGAQPVGAVRTSGGTTVNVFTIPPDDWVRFAGMAERGHNAETTWENLPRSHNLVFGR